MRKDLFVVCVLAVFTLGWAADSTTKRVTTPQPSAVIAVKTQAQGQKKQQRVIHPTTTWTKIKDLFM